MPHSFCARGCPCWTFPPEGQKQALRMENLSQHMFAHAGLFPRKAKKRPCGWKISLSTCSRLLDFSPGRPKNGLSDGKSLSAHVRACRTFPPEGQKTAFRMELCFFCACGGGRLHSEERRRAPAARYMTGLVYTIACHSLFPGAYAPIASTGRQGNCHFACRASTECEATQLRNAVSQPDTHSEAEG